MNRPDRTPSGMPQTKARIASGRWRRILRLVSSTKKTPGQALVAELNAALPPGVEWTKIERTTIASIEVMADRLAALRRRADAAIANPEASAQQIALLANSARQLEVSMHGLIKSLDPDMVVMAKSVKHQHAANVRWHGATS
jgi:hypothetical protein